MGSGCGLLTVLGAVLAGPTGRAHGLEVSAAALRFARRNVQKQINWRAPLLSPTQGVDSIAAGLCVGSCFEGEAAIGVDHPTSTHRFVFKVTVACVQEILALILSNLPNPRFVLSVYCVNMLLEINQGVA